jgi:hypothetical protein
LRRSATTRRWWPCSAVQRRPGETVHPATPHCGGDPMPHCANAPITIATLPQSSLIQ